MVRCSRGETSAFPGPAGPGVIVQDVIPSAVRATPVRLSCAFARYQADLGKTGLSARPAVLCRGSGCPQSPARAGRSTLTKPLRAAERRQPAWSSPARRSPDHYRHLAAGAPWEKASRSTISRHQHSPAKSHARCAADQRGSRRRWLRWRRRAPGNERCAQTHR